MTNPHVVLTLVAALLLFVAHVIRAIRWGLLFPTTYVARRIHLLLGLGVGYAVDFFVPLRLGEIVRIALVHQRSRIRVSHVAATVLIERAVDLLTVSVMFALILIAARTQSEISVIASLGMATLAVAVLSVMRLVRVHLPTRRVLWRFASIFNDSIRIDIADFFWSASEITTRRTLLGWRFIATSVVMWACYLAAYYSIGQAIGIMPLQVFSTMLVNPFNGLLQNVAHQHAADVRVLIVLFACIPIFGILLLGMIPELGGIVKNVRRQGKSGAASPLAVRKRFDAAQTYDYFLTSLFSGGNNLIIGFGLEGAGDGVIHKFFKGGSDAITALVEVQEKLYIRKFAIGGAADKLKIQAAWLRDHRQPTFPLVDIAGERTTANAYTYDMPLVTPSNDFYEVIHTSPPERSNRLLKHVIEHMSDFHEKSVQEASTDSVTEYLGVKAVKNADAILKFARTLLPSEEFSVNGKRYAFSRWSPLLDSQWLSGQIRDRRVATIHGDLTIENIIISPESPAGFFIIDPNSENIFNSPLIDWAKLMQSLHMGYESLNQNLSCNVSGGVISFAHARSHAYAELHQQLESEARNRLGEDGLREIYLHEIINYLRLTTYKMRQAPMRGLGFFACTTMILDRYLERWP